MPNLTTIIQYVFGTPSQGNHRRKGNKKNVKEEGKLSLFPDNMILYIGNPKDATIKLLELINEWHNVIGYKIHTQKSLDAYILTMNIQKKTLRKQSHSPLQ